MRGIYAIVRGTLLEALRSRLLVILVLFTAGLLLGAGFVQYLTLGEQAKIFKDLCLGLFSVFVALLAIVLPLEQLQRQGEASALAAVLAKPIGRYGFLAGKYMGFCLVLAMVGVAMTGLVTILIILRGAAFDPNVLKASVMIFCQGMILASCVLLIGVVFSGYTLCLVCGISVYLAGNMLEPLREAIAHAESLWAKSAAIFLLYLLPHLENLNVQDAVSLGEPIPWTYLGENVVYSLAYAAVVFAVSAIVFNQKDL